VRESSLNRAPSDVKAISDLRQYDDVVIQRRLLALLRLLHFNGTGDQYGTESSHCVVIPGAIRWIPTQASLGTILLCGTTVWSRERNFAATVSSSDLVYY
jgi:hypothetical protein